MGMNWLPHASRLTRGFTWQLKGVSQQCQDSSITLLVVEHKDRLTRFGFRYVETLLEIQGRKIEVVNLVENDKEDLLHDLASIVYSFCARLYGQRRAKRKTERLVEQLQAKDDVHATG